MNLLQTVKTMPTEKLAQWRAELADLLASDSQRLGVVQHELETRGQA